MESILSWVSHHGYTGLFALLVLGIIGLPVPDETLLVFSGYLVSTGRLHGAPAFFAALAGSVCGISLSYTIGRTLGHALVVRHGRFLRFTPERLARVHDWFNRIGDWVLAFGYFIPGVRHFTALVAGTSEVDFGTFALFAYVGAAVWVTTFLLIGYVVGENWRAAMLFIHQYTVVLALVLVLLLGGLWWIATRKRSPTTDYTGGDGPN